VQINGGSMIVILTEDTKTGFNFLEMMRDKIFMSPVFIYNTSYGDSNKTGSSSKFFVALSNLIKDKKIKRGDIVYLAYDNIIPTKDRMYNDKKKFETELVKCEKALRRLGVKYYKSNYTSIEELLLSFERLIDFSSIPGRDMDDPNIKLCQVIQNYTKHKLNNLDYTLLFSRRIEAGETIENCLKDLLVKVTTDGKFTNFRIADNSIGTCWCNDCDRVPSTLYCKTCNAVHNTKILNREQIAYRLKYLYNHSLFKSTFDILGIQILI